MTLKTGVLRGTPVFESSYYHHTYLPPLTARSPSGR